MKKFILFPFLLMAFFVLSPSYSYAKDIGLAQELKQKIASLQAKRFGENYLLEVRWGDLKNKLDAQVAAVDFGGTIKVENAKLSIQNLALFDNKEDKITLKNENELAFNSIIHSHIDGMNLKLYVEPEVKKSDVKIIFASKFAGEQKVSLEDLLKDAKEFELKDNYYLSMKIKAFNPAKPFLNNKYAVLYRIRWGNLSGEKNLNKVLYNGFLKVNGAILTLVQPYAAEINDEIKEVNSSEIAVKSNIEGHFDGAIIKMTPATADSFLSADSLKDATLQIKLNDFTKEFRSVNEFGLFDLGNGHQLEVKKQYVPYALLDEKKYEQEIKKQERILKEMDKLNAQMKKLAEKEDVLRDKLKKLEELKGKIETYNYAEELEDSAKNMVNELLKKLESANLSDQEMAILLSALNNQFQELRGKSVLKKFTSGIVPFKDTDDDEWFTEFVDYVKVKGIVSGYFDNQGNPLNLYKPGDNINVAEMLKIALRSAKFDETKTSGDSKNAQARKTWAKQYFKLAEDLGLTLTNNKNEDPARKITRAEVVKLVLEAFKIEPDPIIQTSFVDVKVDHPAARYIEMAKKLGIVSGINDGNSFAPDSPINRAEVAKIMKNAIEVFGR